MTLALAGCAPLTQPMAPATQTPFMSQNAFIMADGYELPYRVWRPSQEVKATFIVLHGFNDHSRFFEAAGTFFASQGILSYAYDQRGFGRTQNIGIWPGIPTLVNDLVEVIDLIDKERQGPLYVVGASMGGAVVLSLMASDSRSQSEDRLAGTILVAPAIWSQKNMNIVYRAGLWITRTFFPSCRARPPEGLKIIPSDNIAAIQRLRADPLFIKQTRFDTLAGVVDLMEQAFDSAQRIRGPTLILYGANEQILPTKDIDRFIDRIPRENARLAVYSTGYHMLLRDLNAAIVYQDILEWVEDSRAILSSEIKQGPIPWLPFSRTRSSAGESAALRRQRS